VAQGLFVTATRLGQGKTWLIRGIARSLRRKDVRVAALKPIEMGCMPEPKDAFVLSRTCMEPQLVDGRDFYRVASPHSPYAATLEGAPPPADTDRIASSIRSITGGFPVALVEGVGGLMTPIDRERVVADLALEVGFPLLIVARDQAGVVDDVLMATEAARARGLKLSAVVLVRPEVTGSDYTRGTNQRILAQRLTAPVRIFPSSRDDDNALADAADSADLPDLLS